MSFAGVGVTPADRYQLEVSEAGVVTGWQSGLQSGREGAFDGSAPVEVGPLELSLKRTSREGDTVIRFEDVSAR